MGGDVFWLDCGEIDIMEFVGYNLGMIYVNVYIGVYNWVAGINKGDFIWIEDVFIVFYVYVIDWILEWIDFYVDFICYFFFEWEVEVDFQCWLFDCLQAFKFNLVIGGNWGGRQGIDIMIFFQWYYIDYVWYMLFSL